MRLDEIIKHYITPIPKFEELGSNFTGQEILEHFRKQEKFHEIEPFNRIRFEKKFREIIRNQNENDQLNFLSSQINELSQKLFEKKFPQYY